MNEPTEPVEWLLIAILTIIVIAVSVFLLVFILKLIRRSMPHVWRTIDRIIPLAGRLIDRLLPDKRAPVKQEIHHHYVPQYDQSQKTENVTDSVYYRRDTAASPGAAKESPGASGERVPGERSGSKCPGCGEALEAHWKVCPGCERRLSG